MGKPSVTLLILRSLHYLVTQQAIYYNGKTTTQLLKELKDAIEEEENEQKQGENNGQ